MSTDIVEQFDNMVGHIVSVNDERDIVPLLLGLKELWPKVRAEIERLNEEVLRLQGIIVELDDALTAIKRGET